eukprot:TRINITY_DN3049_c0_g1_i6.p1 TRINITY_DN3049_c0_g1~~TRINITY_DN3049_c0_g1_i6.p1  ORF type:complete len:1531 (-),score=371.56 TRINITY_DN3049_c0_g1_i6:86-4678(-)
MGGAQSQPTPDEAPATTSLYLSSQHFAEIPKDILTPTNFQFVTIIDLNDNELTSVDGLEGFAPCLVQLDLSHNRLAHVLPITQLRSLTHLNMAHNLLATLPQQIGELSLLRELNVSHNQLSSLPPSLSRLSSLRVLNVSSNQLTSLLSPDADGGMGGLFCLTRLEAQGNRLPALPPEITSCTELILLNLANNKIASLPDTISNLQALTKLYINNNRIEHLPSSLQSCLALRELNVRGNRLADITKTLDIQFLESIIVDVAHNPLEKKVLEQFSAPDPVKPPEAASRQEAQQGNQPFEDPAWDYGKRMYQIRFAPDDATRPLVRRVDVHIPSVSEKGVFILECYIARKIFVYSPVNSAKDEIDTALKVAEGIAAENVDGLRLVLVDQDSSLNEQEEFWQELDDKQVPASPSRKSGSVDHARDNWPIRYVLNAKGFRFKTLGHGSTQVSIEFVAGLEHMSRELLKRDSCFVLDCADDLWVWVGEGSPAAPREWGMLKAEELLTNGSRPRCACIQWIVQGSEPALFRLIFPDWDTYVEQRTPVLASAPAHPAPLIELALTFDTPTSEAPHASPGKGKGKVAGIVMQKNEDRPSMLRAKSKPSVNQAIPAKPASGSGPALIPSSEYTAILDAQPGPSSRATNRPVLGAAIEKPIRPALQRTSSVPSTRPAAKPAANDYALVTGPILDDVTAGANKLSTIKRNIARNQQTRAATKNPVRERQQQASNVPTVLSEAAKKERQEAQAKLAATRSIHAGGYGVLLAAGADAFMFQKRKMEQAAQSSAGSSSSSSAPREDKDGPRLLHVKGRRRPFVRRVELSWKSLNSGDVFILDTGKPRQSDDTLPDDKSYGPAGPPGKVVSTQVVSTLYQWNGSMANRIEKGKALDIVKKLRERERPGAKLITLEEGQQDETFWEYLGVPGPIAPPEVAGDDLEVEKTINKYTSLFRILSDAETDAAGGIGMAKVEPPLVKEMMQQDQVFLLDSISEVYLWIGNRSKKDVRARGALLADQLHASRDVWTAPVSKEYQDSEQLLYKEKFTNWGGAPPISVQQERVGVGVAASREQEAIDMLAMHAGKLVHKPLREEPLVMDQDPNERVALWRVEGFEKKPLDPAQYGRFYTGDAYLVHYIYVWKNTDRHILYFYQGRAASINDKGASALLTIEMDDKLNRVAKEVRVVQNKEPLGFLKLFKGKMLVRQGRDPDSSGVPAPLTPVTQDPLRNILAAYDIRGAGAADNLDVRAIQVSPSVLLMHSDHALALVTTRDGAEEDEDPICFAWYGKGANSVERIFAINLLADLGQVDIRKVEEGEEPDAFWEAFGGRPPEYPPPLRSHPTQSQAGRTPRLFQCSVGSGIFGVEELVHFSQDDLATDDVMILDTPNSLFLWVGKVASEMERKMGMQTALEYVRAGPEDQKQKPCYFIREGCEPLEFCIHFHGWQWGARRTERPVPAPDYVHTHGTHGWDPSGRVMVQDMYNEYFRTYSYDDLKNKRFPKGLNVKQLESYLADEEFLEVFKMNKEEFEKCSAWKKEMLKKQLELF